MLGVKVAMVESDPSTSRHWVGIRAGCRIDDDQLSDGQRVVQVRGALTLVLHKTTEGWKIIHDHTSSVPITGGE
jgi:ketosteroid isomerase-like protein